LLLIRSKTSEIGIIAKACFGSSIWTDLVPPNFPIL
jgi:hypothetical protein